MKSTPIYAAERADGLAQSIAKQGVLAYLSPVLTSPDVLQKQLMTDSVVAAAKQALGNEVTFDLYPIHTILVSTGWNNNDDVFLGDETWAARLTPEDKPFNLGHEPRKIIGHITTNMVVDDNLTVIADDIAFDDVPDKFHILTSAVVYRHIHSRDTNLEAESAALIESIQAGDWFVSMEALFGGFDYGLTYASGEEKIISRTHSTAFLTKHLRIHGGCGEYNGGKLGRVLRNITFSGKGLVQNPANPESVIFNDTKRFVGVVAEQHPESFTDNQSIGGQHMADNEKYAGQLEDQVKGLQADLAAANKKVDELGEAQVKSALAEKSTEISKLESDLSAAQTKIEELTASFNDAVKAKDTAEADKVEVDTKLAEATTKLSEVEVIAKTTARVSLMVDKGIDKADAEVVVAEFSDLDDDKFAKVVEMKSEAAQAKSKDKEEDDKDKGTKADADTEPDSDPDGEAAASDADLDNAEADADPALGSDDGTGDKDELMTSLASFLDTTMHGEPAGN